MKKVIYQCDACGKIYEGEKNKNVITFETSEEKHICSECFEKFGKDIAYSIEYINVKQSENRVVGYYREVSK